MESAKKENLRKAILESRPHSSEGLTENLIRLSLELNANAIASYWPTSSEPDVTAFNNWVELMGKKLLTPRVTGSTLEFASGPTRPGQFGILEPTGEPEVLGTADLILIPALAVDTQGNRLGKGKGYYDRALVGIKSQRFAVIFDLEFIETVPAEDHDVRVNGSVSPSAIRYLFHG